MTWRHSIPLFMGELIGGQLYMTDFIRPWGQGWRLEEAVRDNLDRYNSI